MTNIFQGSGIELRVELENEISVEYQLLEVEKRLENTEVLTREAQEVAQADMERRFVTETDPDGFPWAELVRPEDEQIGILRRGSTDAYMYHQAISDEAWSATPVGLFFRTDDLPDYWVFAEQEHNEGASRQPQRRFIGLSVEAERKTEVVADKWLAAATTVKGKGRGKL